MPCGSLSISCCLSYQRYRTYQIVFKTDPMWPNPTKIILGASPESTPWSTKRLLGDHCGLLMEQSITLNTKKTPKWRPRASRRGKHCQKISSNFNVFPTLVSTLFFKQLCPTFWRLWTSKIWFSSRRNANFHQMEVLGKKYQKSQHFGPFFDPKSKKIPSKKRD